MSSMFHYPSSARERIYRPSTGFVSGVGEVPSGPRSWRSYSNRPSERIRTNSPVPPITVKQEDVDTESSMFMPAATNEALEEGEVTENIKHEGSPESTRTAESDLDYQNIFASLLAASSRSTRSDTFGSSRQDTSEGRLSRSEVSANSRDRNRSRSPRGSLRVRRSPFRDRGDSPMFYPDSRRGSRQSRSQSMASPSDARRESERPTQERTSTSDPRSSSQAVSTASQQTTPPDGTEEEEDDRCRCPIGYICAVRNIDCLDCRPLVREYGSWTQRRDEEAFERHRALTSNGTKFVADADLVKIINHLNRFVTAAAQTGRDAAVSSIRAWIMEMEDVTITVGTQRDITNQQVLPALRTFLASASASVRQTKNLPAYIEEELTVLERKWGRGDLCGDPKRGLLAIDKLDVNGNVYSVRHEVDLNWPFYVSARYFGAGQLVNGQIWESRVELQRDGVHAPRIAGISGKSKEGARSVLLGSFDEKNNVGYADIDMGEIIEYVGTALKDQDGLGPTNIKDPHMSIPGAWDQNSCVEPTAATMAMFKSMETKEPVRVIRSFKMCDIVTNKPTKGYRYDGLYQVVRATALKEARQIWSFRMVRLPDHLPAHGPLRGFANGSRRRDASGRRPSHFARI